MDLISLLTGLVVGSIIGFLIFKLFNQSGFISGKEHETLKTAFNEKDTSLKISEDRNTRLQETHQALMVKLNSTEQELTTFQSKVSAQEADKINMLRQITELNDQRAQQTIQQATQQAAIDVLKQQNAELNAGNAAFIENVQAQKVIQQKQEIQIAELIEHKAVLRTENSTLLAQNVALTEKQSTQKEEIIELQKTSHLEFEKIASKILEEKSDKFTIANKANIEALLKPLGENIDTFKKKVEETYDKESKQRFSLEEKVKELIEQTNKVSSEANNLATALKGQSKKQGNWGEMILESILQQSGLVKDREYFLQQTIKDEEGKSLRPDVLVKLPDNRIIIIDSKVSLVAYDRFSASETTEEQSIHLAEHLKSIYAHIDNLHGKNYDHLEASLDFTMMFIPIEPSYLIAIQSDQNLWSYAYSKRILLISPTNLIACLKLMSDLWKREMQSKNAQEIVKRGELLYEKFAGFVTTLEELGRHINKTQVAYNGAIGQLNSGSGNLVGQALKLKGLGLKSSKEIPAAMLPTDFDPEEEAKDTNHQLPASE